MARADNRRARGAREGEHQELWGEKRIRMPNELPDAVARAIKKF